MDNLVNYLRTNKNLPNNPFLEVDYDIAGMESFGLKTDFYYPCQGCRLTFVDLKVVITFEPEARLQATYICTFIAQHNFGFDPDARVEKVAFFDFKKSHIEFFFEI